MTINEKDIIEKWIPVGDGITEDLLERYVKCSKIADEHLKTIINAVKIKNDTKRANYLQTYIARQEKTLRGEK